MNEFDIKNEFDGYEIKTTSKMILDKLPKKKERKFPFLVKLSASFSVLLVSVTVLVLALILNNNSSSVKTYSNTVSLDSSSVGTQVALEVLYAGNMTEETNTTYSLNSEITESDFSEAVSNVETLYPLFTDLYL